MVIRTDGGWTMQFLFTKTLECSNVYLRALIESYDIWLNGITVHPSS